MPLATTSHATDTGGMASRWRSATSGSFPLCAITPVKCGFMAQSASSPWNGLPIIALLCFILSRAAPRAHTQGHGDIRYGTEILQH
jgi:hypothetical protein